MLKKAVDGSFVPVTGRRFFVRTVAIVLGVGVLAMSQCWAHGHASAPGATPLPDHSLLDNVPERSEHDLQQTEPRDPKNSTKNPYENLSCPQLYVLATQTEQNPNLADAFKDKDCHAL
jgi:hypothetical protein